MSNGSYHRTLMTSCNNFMDAKEVKNEIVDAIAYNNAKEITLQIDSEGMGLVFPKGSITKKIGYDFEIQFKPDTENYSITNKDVILRAVNYYNPEELYDSNSVAFTALPQTDQDKMDGLYRVNVKVLKDVSNLLIVPDCLPLPAITSVSPAYNPEGINSNQPVSITFNMPMEYKSREEFESVFNYENIKIKYGDREISSLFEKPVLNGDKTILNIIPRGTALSDFMDDKEVNVNLLEVTFEFSTKISVNIGDETIKLKQNDFSSFTVCYTKELDETPPNKIDFFVTRTPITVEDASAATQKFVNKTLSDTYDFTNDEILQNRVKDYIYIYGHYRDNDCGVKTITVYEKCTNAREDGDPLPDEEEIKHTFIVETDKPEFVVDDSGNTRFVLKCPVESKDGAVLVRKVVCDAFDNPSSPHNLTVFKKSSVMCSQDNLLIENIPVLKYYLDFAEGAFDYSYYQNNVKKIKVYFGSEVTQVNDIIYGEKIYDEETMYSRYSVYAEYNGKKEKLNKYTAAPITSVSGNSSVEGINFFIENSKGWYLDLAVEKINDLVLKIIVEDDIGASFEKTFNFPQSQRTIYTSKNKVKFQALNASAANSTTIQCLYDNNSKIKSITEDYTLESEVNYYPVPINLTVNLNPVILLNSFFGDIGDAFSALSQEEYAAMTIPALSLGTPEWQRSSKNSQVDLVVPVNNSSEYDVIKIIVRTSPPTEYNSGSFFSNYFDNPNHENIQCVLTNSTYNAFKRNPHIDSLVDKDEPFDFNNKFKIEILGIKGNKTITTSTTIDRLDPSSAKGKEVDNYPSVVYRQESLPDYYCFDVEKYAGCAPDYAIISLNNGKTYRMDSSNEYKCSIPKWEMDLKIGVERVVGTYEAYDVNGYKSTGTITEQPEKGKYICHIVKDGDYWNFKSDVLQNGNWGANWYVSTDKLNSDGTWTECMPEVLGAANKETDPDGYIYTFKRREGSNPTRMSLPANSLVRIISRPGFYNEPYVYYVYTGTQNSGHYDYYLPNNGYSEEDKNSILVVSDAPAFAHTMVTNRPYSECKDWAADDWEFYARGIGDSYLPCSSSVVPVRYSIPVSGVQTKECYVTIIHYADGTMSMTDVKQKN